MESKIREAYSELVDELASTAKMWLDENDYSYTLAEAVERAIDDEFIWEDDKIIVLGHALSNGLIEWGAPFDWQAIENFLFDNVLEELVKLVAGLKEKGGENV